MYRRAEEMASEIRGQLRGGKGSVEITQIFTEDEFRGKARLIARITLEPGCSIGHHEHVDEEEFYIITKGEGVLTDSTLDTEVTLRPGDASLTLGGQSHAIRNAGSETLEFLAVILLY